jgi:hypothetical protein
VTSFRQLSGEVVIGVELKVEHYGEGLGGEEVRRKRVKRKIVAVRFIYRLKEITVRRGF